MEEERIVECCGRIVHATRVVKLSERECAIAAYFCVKCGKIFDEFKAPLFYNEKAVFFIDGEIVFREP